MLLGCLPGASPEAQQKFLASDVIPDFDIHGRVPPVRPGARGVASDRAPYRTGILTFCQRFGTNIERRTILLGLLDLRRALRTAGIIVGFQWLDGSFAEDVERLRNRGHADIDVVTFCALGNAAKQEALLQAIPEFFEPTQAKTKYKVDHYFVPTDCQNDLALAADEIAHRASYWYSMWAHQRDTLRWKGFVSVPLDSDDDQARAWLEPQLPSTGGSS